MKGISKTADDSWTAEPATDDQLTSLLNRSPQRVVGPFNSVIVGELLGIQDTDRTPLVCYPGQTTSAAVPARSTVDLAAPHVGCQVVLVFEGGEPDKPIIIGVLATSRNSIKADGLDVEIESDGQRVILNAKEELILRCGSASVTLTKDGRVLLRGVHVSTHAEGVNRIKGGSVQIN